MQAAAARLAGHVLATPCLESCTLGQILGARVFLKFENLQFTASFKERGALNKLARLLATGQPVKGVIAASAGNDAQALVDEWMLVDEGDIEQAIVMLLEIEKTVVEGAGAAGLAALLKAPASLAGKNVGLVLCGGNIDPLRLQALIGRGMVRARRLARVRVEARDAPGVLAELTSAVARCGANIEEVHHQRAFSALPLQQVEIELVLQTRNHAHVRAVIEALSAQGFNAVAC